MANVQIQAAEEARSSQGTGAQPFSFLFLSDKNLRKFNIQEDTIINQVLNESKAHKAHKVFVKWTDAYLENLHGVAEIHEDPSTDAVSIIGNYPARNTERIQYTFASCMKEENISDIDAARRVFEELISSDQDPRVNLIILTDGSSGLNIAKKLFAMIDESLNKKSYCVWGAETFGLTDVKYKEDGKLDSQKPIFMGIRMLNSSMKSWSLIVDFRQFKEKLVEFKKHIQLKRFSLGFVSGRSAVIHQEVFCGASMEVGGSRVVESSEFMNIITATFPNTIFYGGFNLGLDFIYGFNSLGGDDGIVTNKLAVSLMIVTHD